jgi:hypothetical protein
MPLFGMQANISGSRLEVIPLRSESPELESRWQIVLLRCPKIHGKQSLAYK